MDHNIFSNTRSKLFHYLFFTTPSRFPLILHIPWQKGEDLCLNSMREQPEEKRQEAKSRCLSFYFNNLLVFQDNVLKKLNDLTRDTSFENL